MKKIFLLLSLLTLSSFTDIYVDNFNDSIHEAYDEYRNIHEYSNINYTIKLVQGIMKNKVYFGLCFYNENAQAYNLRLNINGKEYKLPSNSRNDINIVALDFKNHKSFSLVLYDNKNRIQTLLIPEFTDVPVLTQEELSALNLKIGSGQGASITKAASFGGVSLSSTAIFFIVLSSILVICVVIILIYYIKRKGMFAPGEHKKNVFDFKQFIISVEQEVKQEAENEEYYYPDIEYEETKDISPSSYVPHYPWARSEDNTSDYNIKAHLQNLGFVTDYRLITTEEKNNITIELMRLRDEKRITKDDYLNEMGKLWK